MCLKVTFLCWKTYAGCEVLHAYVIKAWCKPSSTRFEEFWKRSGEYTSWVMCIRQVCEKYILVNVVLDLDSTFACYAWGIYMHCHPQSLVVWIVQSLCYYTTLQKSVGLVSIIQLKYMFNRRRDNWLNFTSLLLNILQPPHFFNEKTGERHNCNIATLDTSFWYWANSGFTYDIVTLW